jgi:hypothetical protein
MFETFRTFSDYVRDYELQRSEGLLLRHLSSVHKVLTQTVPDRAKTEAVRELELYLGTMIRQVDSSLLEEWERMQDPNYQTRQEKTEVRPPGAEEAAKDITRDAKSFTSLIRNRVFTFLRAIENGDYEQALAAVSAREGFSANTAPSDHLQAAVSEYRAGHGRICLDPNARNLRHTYVIPSEDRRSWRVQQMLVDPEEHNDWVAEFEADLEASRASNEPVLKLVRIGPLV